MGVRSPLLVLAVAMGSSAVQANITFNITYDSSVTGLANYLNGNIPTAVNYVKNEYSALYSDPITLNITIAGNTTGLGGSNTFFQSISYANLVTALSADAKTGDDANFVASLPGTDPIGGTHNWAITCSQAKALGVSDACGSGSDGTYTFNDTLAYTYDPLNRAVSGEFDFIGVTEHEFSEIMGRIFLLGTSVNFGGGAAPTYILNDLDRFTAAGVRSFANCQSTSTSGIYLSPNNGTTNLAGFNNNAAGDCDDLDGTVATDPYNAFTGSNQAHALSTADGRWMDIIGYDLAAPEPGTFALVGGMLLGVGILRRRLAARK